MEIETIGLLAGALLSLLFAYVPGFKTWYEKLPSGTKQLVMLAAIFAIVGGAYGVGCLGYFDYYECNQAGVFDALVAFVLAIAANAGVYKATNYVGLGRFRK